MTAVADGQGDSDRQESVHWKRWAVPGLAVVAALVAGTVILLLAKQNLELKAALAGFQSPQATSIWEPGGSVPAVGVIDLKGQQMRAFPDLVEEGALIGFFTTSCPHCAETLPLWIGLQRKAERHGMLFLAVSLHDQERTRAFVQGNSTPYDVWAVAGEEESRQLGVTGVPLTVLLQPGGRIVNAWGGALTEEDVRAIETELSRITAPSF